MLALNDMMFIRSFIKIYKNARSVVGQIDNSMWSYLTLWNKENMAKHVTRIDSQFTVATQRQLRDPVSGLHAGKRETLTKMDYFYF